MKKMKLLTYAFAFALLIGFTSCTEDPAMDELIDSVELGTLDTDPDDGSSNGNPNGGG